METQILFNENMHFEHLQWKGEIDFWKDELKSFNNRLNELITRSKDKKVVLQLSHYQTQFILHDGVIEDLEETIEKHEIRIAGQSKTGTNAIDTELAKQHIEFRNKMETQRHIYAELKKEFFRFLQEYM